ncbi:MAG: 5'-methylthioadenosine/adenosylhomocysteine nucleosidase [Buchnera aphidicola (Nurudea yanoniella)]
MKEKNDKKNITIGIIGALSEEINLLYKYIKFYKKKIIYNKKFYIGKLKNIKIILIQSGIGKTSASITCTILLYVYKIDVIINIGTAGSLSKNMKLGTIVLPCSTCYHDVDLTPFGYKKGQVKNFPQIFSINNYLTKLIETYMIKLNIYYKKGLIISGDSFIHEKTKKNKLKIHFPEAIAVDMESTAIAQVCYQFNKPFLIIKTISDHSNNYAALDFQKFSHLASEMLLKIFQYFLHHFYIHE